jgi:hypothetical protein
MNLKKLLLGAVAGMLLASSAEAQVNAVPQFGVNTENLRHNTFSAISVALVPAASATDVWCISAGASKNIYLEAINISGTAGTAVTTPVVLLRRNTALDSGGTAATGLALPVGGGHNYSQNGTSSAVLTAYTANPTVNDASPTYLRAAELALPTSSATLTQNLLFPIGTAASEYDQEFILAKGTTQQICINLNGTSVSSGSLVIWAEWAEY